MRNKVVPRSCSVLRTKWLFLYFAGEGSALSNYWQDVLARLSVPGLILALLGAILCYGAPKIAPRIWKQGGDQAIMPMKVAGLALAILGVLILLDVFPNL